MAEGVADVRLNRPEKLNALDAAMFEGLVETGRRLAADTSVRAVVLSGEGRGFCAGLDFVELHGDGGRWRAARGCSARDPDSPVNAAQRAAWIWAEVPVPVIAAIHGVAFGGGLQIALAADLRFVTPEAQLSVMEIRWGLDPGHDRHADVAPPGAARRRQGADLQRPHRHGTRGRGARPRDARRGVAPAMRRSPWRGRSPSARRMRSAPARSF